MHNSRRTRSCRQAHPHTHTAAQRAFWQEKHRVTRVTCHLGTPPHFFFINQFRVVFLQSHSEGVNGEPKDAAPAALTRVRRAGRPIEPAFVLEKRIPGRANKIAVILTFPAMFSLGNRLNAFFASTLSILAVSQCASCCKTQASSVLQ